MHHACTLFYVETRLKIPPYMDDSMGFSSACMASSTLPTGLLGLPMTSWEPNETADYAIVTNLKRKKSDSILFIYRRSISENFHTDSSSTASERRSKGSQENGIPPPKKPLARTLFL
ncbi:hypothetical protein VNO77_33996 [Canavalia gladiata]|uniref:Uncharacterized protein n=1 Tax=Canavalia gladiata TaxID=3824 RepID=A0AAN9KEE4_CANGL